MAAKSQATVPSEEGYMNPAPRLTVPPAYTDPRTGAVYIHQDFAEAVKPWETEAHVGPFKVDQKFGDIESWSEFVHRFAIEASPPLLTWSENGLRAVLDYGTLAEPGRQQVVASHPFARSIQWQAWSQLASGRPLGQRDLIERLEDLAPDIVEPNAAELMTILRTLRSTANASADSELRPDGTTQITWSKNTSVKAGAAGDLTLPAEFQIAIPVLRGHTHEVDGKPSPVLYRLAVKLRVSVAEVAALSFRLSMPGAERTLEDVYADRVAVAKALLGETFVLLRAAA